MAALWSVDDGDKSMLESAIGGKMGFRVGHTRGGKTERSRATARGSCLEQAPAPASIMGPEIEEFSCASLGR